MAVPSYSINWDSLFTSTLKDARSDVYDATFGSSPFWNYLHKKGRKRMFSGGVQFQINLEYAQNNTVSSMRGYDPVDRTPQEHLTAAIDAPIEVAGAVSISKREELLNSGEAQLINLLQSKIKNLGKSFSEKMSQMVLAASGADVFTPGNGAKDMNPLLLLDSPTTGKTVHNISSSTYTWWENTAWADSATATGGSDATKASDLRQMLRHQYNLAGKHAEGFPDMVLTSLEGFEAYVRSLESQLRYTSTERADQGFRYVECEGMTMMWDRRCPRSDDGVIENFDDSGLDEELYFLINSEYLYLVVHEQADLITLPFQQADDQMARSAITYFMGQLMTSNRRCLTGIKNFDAALITSWTT
jgi:hypothetical protein